MFGEPCLEDFRLYERKIGAIEYIEQKCTEWKDTDMGWYETYDDAPDTWFLYERIDDTEYVVVLKIVEREIM